MSGKMSPSGLVPQGQKASDYDNSGLVPPRQNVVPPAEKTDSSQQGFSLPTQHTSVGEDEKINVWIKGHKERSPPHNLRQKPGQYICCQNHKLIADIENDIMDPVMQCTTLPDHRVSSQQKTFSFVTEIHTFSMTSHMDSMILK
ncbi:hypothetical protein Tco_0404795 [Tanacetum coccineum]